MQKCQVCNKPGCMWHHIVPRSLGGPDTSNNLVLLCKECHGKAHGRKGFRDISTLTKKALQRKKEKGERTGGIPYGFTIRPGSSQLISDRDEQEVIAVVCKLRDEGQTYRGICSCLHQKDIKPRSGKSWHPNTIFRIVKANSSPPLLHP